MKRETTLEHLKNRKHPTPLLSFPVVQLLDITVRDLINDFNVQAMAMKKIVDEYPVGAVVSMMDLSVEAEAFGANIRYFDMEVPTVVGKLINDIEDAKALKVPKISGNRMESYVKTINKASEIIIDKPIFAGVIGPFSLAGRLMDMTEIMINCYIEPEMVHITLKKTAELILNYILEFKKAGATGVIMAEPAAGLLSPDLCDEFSSRYIKEICSKVKDENFIFIYHNCGNVIPLVDSLSSIDADCYHFGNSIDIEEMLKRMPSDKIIMGNVDPSSCFCYGTKENIYDVTINLLTKCSKYDNFIISSGCDIPPKTPWENIKSFFKAVDDFYNK